jgi:sporulation protein YlmC with PRC-barrel domain
MRRRFEYVKLNRTVAGEVAAMIYSGASVEKYTMLLTIGATIRCRDGAAGRLKYVVLDPEDNQVTHLIVERGRLLHRDIVVPVGWVERTSEDEIVLKATIAELDTLPDYDELDFVEPDVKFKPAGGYRSQDTRFWRHPSAVVGENIWIARIEHLGLHDGEVFLQHGLPVVTRDERPVGEVDRLDVEPASRRVTHLVVRQGWLWKRQARMVPIERVTQITEAGVRLNMTEVEFNQAPPYQPPAPPLRIGAPVYARDGRYGTLDKVVIDPYACRVTHLVVRHGWLLPEDRVIPLERVERVERDGVYLDQVAAELDQYSRYREEKFVEPLADWQALEPYAAADTLFWGGPYIGVAPPVLPVVEHVVSVGVPESEIVLQRGADVFYNDELVGSLNHLLIDPASGTVTHLVIEEDGSDRRVIAPVEWVCELYAEAIVLDHWQPDQPGVPTNNIGLW